MSHLEDSPAAASVAAKALDLGGHAPGAHHRLVSHRKPAPQDIEALWMFALAPRGSCEDLTTRVCGRVGRICTSLRPHPSLGARCS